MLLPFHTQRKSGVLQGGEGSEIMLSRKEKTEEKNHVNFISTQKRFTETTAKAKDNCFAA